MEQALAFLGAVSALELLLWLPPVWRWRKPAAVFLVLALIVGNGWLLAAGVRFWTAMLVFLSLYRLVNLWRVYKGRVQMDYLYRSARRTSLWLIGLQAVTVLLAELAAGYHASTLTLFYAVVTGQVLVGGVLWTSVRRHLRTTRPPKITAPYSDEELPTLTVAIPARNETSGLEACLQSLVASDYPKLEILVLDDCSQNKRTPEIIRGFAHDGVRFLAGETPPEHWLAKNYAYARLAKEANGDLLLFCGADARFEPASLRALVKLLLQKKKNMISVLPENRLPAGKGLVRLFMQPNRYAWELAPPRRLLRRPPVLSTCWLIRHQTLNQAGGLAAVSRKIMPESYFARQTAASDDGYSFLQSGSKLGVGSHKNLEEQKATAVRTRYPQLHRRPEMVALVGLAEFSALLWPLIILACALLSGVWVLAAIAGLAYWAAGFTYGRVFNLTYRKAALNGLWLLPIAAVYDISLVNYSMWQYEFGEVIWKGRNVCLPVMRLAPLTAKPD